MAHQPAPPGEQREAGPPARIMAQAASVPCEGAHSVLHWHAQHCRHHSYGKGLGNPSPRKPEGRQGQPEGAEQGQMMQIPANWNFSFLKSPATLRPVQLLSNTGDGLDTLNSAPWQVRTHCSPPPQQGDSSWCSPHLRKLTWDCPSHTAFTTAGTSSNPDQRFVGKLLSAKINFYGLQLST